MESPSAALKSPRHFLPTSSALLALRHSCNRHSDCEKLTINWEWSNPICALGQRGRAWDYKISYVVDHLPFPGEGVGTVERFPSIKLILETSLHAGTLAASVGTVPPWDEHRWRIKSRSLNLSNEIAALLSRKQPSTSRPQHPVGGVNGRWWPLELN